MPGLFEDPPWLQVFGPADHVRRPIFFGFLLNESQRRACSRELARRPSEPMIDWNIEDPRLIALLGRMLFFGGLGPTHLYRFVEASDQLFSVEGFAQKAHSPSLHGARLNGFTRESGNENHRNAAPSSR
jgi:hypothetical protein